MKILILTSRYPLPEMGGDYLRINSIARYLRQQGHEIILLSLFHRKESQEINDTSLYNKTWIIRRSRFFSYLYMILAFLLAYPMQIGYFFSFRFLFKLKRIIREELARTLFCCENPPGPQYISGAQDQLGLLPGLKGSLV